MLWKYFLKTFFILKYIFPFSSRPYFCPKTTKYVSIIKLPETILQFSIFISIFWLFLDILAILSQKTSNNSVICHFIKFSQIEKIFFLNCFLSIKIKHVLPIKIFNITAKKAINDVPATKGCQNESTTFGSWTKSAFGLQTSTWSKETYHSYGPRTSLLPSYARNDS